MWSNCLAFALGRYWQQGGYVVMMRSRFGWWPHFVWTADLKDFEEFAPKRKRRRWFPPLIFRGRVKPWVR